MVGTTYIGNIMCIFIYCFESLGFGEGVTAQVVGVDSWLGLILFWCLF